MMINIIGNAIGAQRGGSSVNEAFEFTVKTDNAGTSAADQFTIPITSATPYDISTSDGHSITGATGATTLTFSAPGTYTVSITESCEGWRFNNGGDKLKLLDISNWGVYANTATNSFYGASNMTCSAVDKPIGTHTTLNGAFYRCTLFNGAIGNWDVSAVTDMGSAFSHIYAVKGQFNQDISGWDVSNVTSFVNMFNNTIFNQDISGWNMSSMTAIAGMFQNANLFNQDISSWPINQVTSLDSVFNGASSFNQDISAWDTSNVTSFRNLFSSASAMTYDISNWNVSSLTNLERTFNNADLMNLDLSSWNTINVTRMTGTFGSIPWNPNISSWNTSSVTHMDAMFYGNVANITDDYSSWDTSNVITLESFGQASNFNGNISAWNTSNVTNLRSFMYGNSTFSGDLSAWNTSSVTTMIYNPFYQTSSFDSDLGGWDVSNVSVINGIFKSGIPFSTANYDSLLSGWEASLQAAYPGGVGYPYTINVSFPGSQYTLGSAAETARTSLINTFGWTITDGGGVPAPLILRVDTSLGDGLPNMRLPMVSGTYDVDWGDGNVATGQTGGQTHTYATGGVYDIKVTGGTLLQYNFGADVLKVTNLLQWGASAWTNAYGMFGGCENMVITATDIPNWSVCSNFQRMFRRTTFTNVPNIDQWDMSNATILSELFWETACDPDVSSWQITQVTAFNNFANAPSAFTTSNYDNILVSWEAQLQAAFPGGVGYTPTISIVFAGTQYTLGSAADTARASLISNFGWTIIDGGGVLTNESYLVASYNFDTNFTDYTGNHPLTATGSVTAGIAGGKVSNCSDFNGTTGYLTAADSDDFSFTNGVNDLPFSISFWFNFDSGGVSNFVQKRNASSDFEWQIIGSSSSIFIDCFSNGIAADKLRKRYSATFNNNTWYHFTATYDGSGNNSGLKIYIDGLLTAAANQSTGTYVGMTNFVSNTWIGTEDGITGMLNGQMDELHIWKNRELTAAEVTDIYNTENAGNGILPGPYLLNNYGGAAAAYSLRDLSSSTTNVVRVRRSSDNTEQDFTSTQVTDGTLTTFVGAGNDGFVTVWYDQSGAGNDITFSPAPAEQAQIVTSGSLNLDNGTPYMLSTGRNFGQVSLASALTSTNGTLFCQYNTNDTGAGCIIAQDGSFYAGLIDSTSGSNAEQGMGTPAYYKNGTIVTPDARNNLYTAYVTNQDVLIGVTNLNLTNYTLINRVYPYSYTVDSFTQIVKMKEWILFDADQSSNKTAIESNINSYYTIY